MDPLQTGTRARPCEAACLKRVMACAPVLGVLLLLSVSIVAGAAEAVSIGDARNMAVQNGRAACTIRGSVTFTPGMMATRPGDFYIQDDTGGILIKSETAPFLKLWDRVEVSGRVDSMDVPKNGAATEGTGRELRIEADRIVLLGPGHRIEPEIVSLSEAISGRHAGEFIAVRGQVTRLILGDMSSKRGEANDHFIIGSDPGLTVYARRLRKDPPWLKDVAIPGSEVEVRGISIPGSAPDFRIRLRASTDLAIVRAPSWFTVRHILWCLGGVACIALITLAWIVSLKRTVHRRTGEIRRAEHQIRHAQKMEVVAQLASGVAHDFNNLLMTINGYSELLLDEQLDEESKRIVEQILKAGQKAAALTRKLQAFSRGQELAPAIVDLNRFIEDFRPKLESAMGKRVHVDIRLGGDRMTITVDPNQLEDILMDLATNARDAMHNQGVLTISTSAMTITKKTDGMMPGHYVVLSVADIGHGMDAVTISRIFEPFFTTKDVGEGSGLGLSTVYGLVRQNNGEIKVRSTVGRGTTFDLYLPYKQGEPDDASQQGSLFDETQKLK